MAKSPSPAPVENVLLNSRDVAAALRISQRTVWKLVANGTLPKPCRLAGSTRWLKADIETFIKALGESQGGDQ
jgi:predicted DNA-binding transcriptional regulator AlpA